MVRTWPCAFADIPAGISSVVAGNVAYSGCRPKNASACASPSTGSSEQVANTNTPPGFTQSAARSSIALWIAARLLICLMSIRCNTSGWRRMVPVALHGASSRMASYGAAGSQSITSAVTRSAFSWVRSRLAINRSIRRAELSSAVTVKPAADSCIVLPPGAAHKSSARLPLPSPSNRAGRLAARSCTHHAPSS